MMPGIREERQLETMEVLEEVFDERCRQERRYGHVNDKLEDGTGPTVYWIPRTIHGSVRPADQIQSLFRQDYERQFDEETRLPTWMHLVREEIAEAFQESDPVRLEEELIQVAALCCSWVERLRKRGTE